MPKKRMPKKPHFTIFAIQNTKKRKFYLCYCDHVCKVNGWCLVDCVHREFKVFIQIMVCDYCIAKCKKFSACCGLLKVLRAIIFVIQSIYINSNPACGTFSFIYSLTLFNVEKTIVASIISNQEKHWPLRTILCFLLVKKSFSILIISPHISFWRSLEIHPTCPTLPKAFEISRNNPRTSRTISKVLKISWLMESSWLMRESPGLKPAYFGDIKSFSKNRT